jgi:two-component system chemotaxis response regulator CheY
MGVQAIKKDRWVLIVDDDEDIRELLGDFLAEDLDGDIRIVEAADGVQASMKLDYQKFDCIVTDLNMPKRGGGGFIQEVKSSQTNKNCPIVVVTGFPDATLLEKFPNMHFIEKPVKKEEFLKTVDTQLRLGQLDKRVNADIFNYVVNATRSLVGKLFDILPTTGTPETKAAGDALEGDMFFCCSIKGATGVCKVAISFEEEFLQLMAKKTKASEAGAKVAAGTGSVILRYVLNNYRADHPQEKILAVENKDVIGDPNHVLLAKMKASPGMIVPIKVGSQFLRLHMLTKMD